MAGQVDIDLISFVALVEQPLVEGPPDCVVILRRWLLLPLNNLHFLVVLVLKLLLVRATFLREGLA